MSWTIYNKTGQIAKCKIHQLEYNGEFMGECSVVCTIKSESPIEFAIGDYLIYRGERFEINYDPTILKKASKNSTGDAFTYDNVKFNSLSDELARCDFLDYVPNDNNIHFTSLPKFSFFASSISNLAERIQVNLDRIYTGNKKWTVIVHPEYVNKKNINISVDTINVWDALALTNSEFEANFIIRGREITIGTAGIAVDNIFKYGKGKGLYEIERNAEADQKIVTRLRAYGSTRNMPDRYYNKLSGSSVGNYLPNNMAVDNLMLPGFPETTLDPYIDSDNIEELGIREGTIFFDGSQEGLEEIFPSIEGMTAQQLEDAGITVSIDPGDNGNLDEVYSAEQLTDDGQADNKGEIEKGNFTVTLKDIGFDINNYLLGETATLSMKDGMCGGRDFEITKCEKHGNKYILTCTRVYDDGIKLFFPYKNYNIKSGDKFVLLDISMPDVYIKAHSQRLLSSAKKWLAKNDYIRYSYIPKVDNIYMARQHDDAVANNQTSIHDTIKEGDLMLFEDDDLGISGSIIIDSLSIKEGDDMIPEYEITLKEEKIVGTLEKIQNQIDSIVSGGQGNGGYNSEQIKSLIKAFGSNFFLRKDKDDRTPHKLSSDKAFEIGKFVSGSTGGIIMVDKETGQTYAEVDKLKVRMKAYFESLEIQNVNSVGGKIVLTPGGAVTLIDVWTKGTIEQTPILSMADGNPILLADGSELQLMDKETVDNGVPEGVYRCFFLAEQDGVEVENRFRAGFQIQSKNFNIQKPGEYQQVANHYYWRLCVGASKEPINVGIYKLHYIDLSMADCDTGSDIPAKGDTVAHLGARIKWKGIDNKDVTDESNIDAQNAIVFSSTDVFSPSVTLYHGIDSYSYLNKEYVEYGVDKTNNKAFFHVYGDAYIGDRDGNSFVKFTQGEGVEIKGKLSVGTTIGNGDTIEDALKKASEKYKEDLDPLKEYIKQEIDNIQNQVDGAIETWFYDPVPTLENLPASDWDTDEKKNNHLGDLYYSKEGKAYRFQYEQEKGWYWNAITDTDIVKALENAQKAQDTADGKRRIFVRQPQNSDAYDIGDMWVNATYGSTYKDDMLRANTSKKAGEAFSISHWELASKYTDDTLAQEAKKIAEETKKAAEKLDSTVSSMKDFTDEAFNDGIVDRGEAAAIKKYLNNIDSIKNDVTESYNKIIENELLDEGVVKTELETAYRLFNSSAQELINTINGVIQDGKTTATEVAMVDGKYSAFNLKYGDFIANVNAANNYIQGKLNESIKEISKNIGDISYLTKALKEYTNIEGGLIQSSLLALGYTSESGFKIMSGTNGVHQSDKRGGGIASWWGGSMLDKFDYPESSVPENVAKGLVRFDGTGYFANGALWWEEDGTLHADPLSFFVGEETVGVLLSAFKFLRSAEFKYILEPQYPFTHIKAINSVQIGNALLKYDAANNAVYVEKDDGSMVNFYATGDLAAFGSTTDSGSGATSLGMLDDVDLVTPLSEGQVLTYDSVKNKWTNKKGGGGLDIDAMWDELAKSDTSKRIHFSHIPDLGSVYAKQVKLGTTPYNVSNGVISLPEYPTKLSQLEDDVITGKYLPLAGGTITGNLAINGTTTANNIVLNKAGNFGNKINFGDGDYVYLKEASDDSLTIYGSKKISLNGSGFGYSFGSDGLIPTSGSKSLGGGWVNHMWDSGWFTKIGCYVIGVNPNDVHNDYNPWHGINFSYNNRVVMSGYHGIDFYTSAGCVAQFQPDGIVNITNLYCYNDLQCRASFVSTMTDYWEHEWRIFQNVDNCVFGANQMAVMSNSGSACRPIIGWEDILSGAGFITRYTIGSIRRVNNWGSMLIAVSNSDDGSTNGVHFQLNGEGTADLVASRFTVSGNFLAEGEVAVYSDARLKSSIKPLRNRGFITPVSYIKDGKESIGFIAQDMIELYPELVSIGSSKEHYLSVNYAQYTAVLQAQIIELHKEIDDLKRKFIN
nr:MAG TPA: Putative tail protein [Caudoviricetes sp.]